MSALADIEKQCEYLVSLKKDITNDIPNVYCIGRQNAGKSTLLDALINDYSMETFPVSDIRETAKLNQYKYQNIMYTDTPGIGHNNEDDKLVFKSIENSDINLFVHIADSGELIKAEVDFLIKIKENWKDGKFIDNTIFVLSQKEKLNPDELSKLKNKIASQISDIFGKTPNIIEVSSKFYIKGIETKNQNAQKKLIESSNFNELKISIDKIKSNIRENKEWRFKENKEKILNLINNKIEENETDILNLKSDIKNTKNEIDKDLKSIEDTVKNILKRLED